MGSRPCDFLHLGQLHTPIQRGHLWLKVRKKIVADGTRFAYLKWDDVVFLDVWDRSTSISSLYRFFKHCLQYLFTHRCSLTVLSFVVWYFSTTVQRRVAALYFSNKYMTWEVAPYRRYRAFYCIGGNKQIRLGTRDTRLLLALLV